MQFFTSFFMCFSLKTANEKSKLEGEWKDARDRKAWQQQEVTIYFSYQREKREPKRDRKLPCVL